MHITAPRLPPVALHSEKRGLDRAWPGGPRYAPPRSWVLLPLPLPPCSSSGQEQQWQCWALAAVAGWQLERHSSCHW